MSDPNRHPLTINPTRLDPARIRELLDVHGQEVDSEHGRRLVAAIAASPVLAGALAELEDGKWTRPYRKPSTKRADQPTWNRFEKWCRQRSLDPLPASTETVLSYLMYYSDTAKPSTVKRARQAIGRAHTQVRLPDPTQNRQVRDVEEGIARTAAVSGWTPQKRNDADFGTVKRLIDAIDDGGYWTDRLNLTEPNQLLVARMLAGRWRAVILTEWVASLWARQSLWATIDDLRIGDKVGLALPATLDRPDGHEVQILGFEERRYDPITALADWIELLLPFLPPCRALFPSVQLRPNPTVVCRVCGPHGGAPHPQSAPDSMERRLAAAVRNDGTAFGGIVERAGLKNGNVSLTRDGLRTGVRAEAIRAGTSHDEIRRQLRLSLARSDSSEMPTQMFPRKDQT